MDLIKTIQLPNGRRTTNLGFGCAGLLRLPSDRGRERLLRTAVDEGLTHFDVARMYGLGTAEGIVGSALKPVANRVTLATKFGLPYTTPDPFALRMQSLARWVANWNPALKRVMKKMVTRPTPPETAPATRSTDYSLEEMNRSLDLSLRQLKTSSIDLFFIHEPAIGDPIPAGMGQALQEKKVAGKIGAYGISAGRAEAEHFLRERPEICGEALQYASSILTPGPWSQPLAHPFSAIFGVLGDAHGPLTRYLEANEKFTDAWSQRLGLDLNEEENTGVIALAIALALNPHGMVIFFTSSAHRLQRMVRRLKGDLAPVATLLEFREAVLGGMHAD